VAEREQAENQGGIPGNFRHGSDEEGRRNVEGIDGQIGEYRIASCSVRESDK